MRLDKFLKVSRLIKRRAVAKEVADQGRIEINGQVAKSSSQVKIDDEITIRFGNRIVAVKVDKIVDSTKKQEALEMYHIVKEERIEKTVIETEEFLA